MNTRKLRKAILTLCSALLLVSLSVGLTVAYLTDETELVKNTFTVGKVAITLDETDVDEYGVKDGDTRVITNDYKLMPGHTYTKDPTVHVAADSEESYVRMLVTINLVDKLTEAFGVDEFLPEEYVNGWDRSKWESYAITTVDNVCTVEFRYYTTVSTVDAAAKDLEPLFTEIKVPEGAENEKLLALEDLQIDIKAQAIQADGFANADAAWTAFANK
ncbi:MAG: SipW-dependent-type signal peptide-containing protein [Clostridia bacterium]|nr:SipW-dependent-type signal peptide-containing protein [Clostridia bacterium]